MDRHNPWQNYMTELYEHRKALEFALTNLVFHGNIVWHVEY